MQLETYKLKPNKNVFVFLDINDDEDTHERFSKICAVLKNAGATKYTKHVFLFHERLNMDADSIRTLIGDLENSECVHVLYEEDGKIHPTMIVAPRLEGGIKVLKCEG